MSRSPNDFDGLVDDFEKAKEEIRKKARKQLQDLERRKKQKVQERYALMGEMLVKVLDKQALEGLLQKAQIEQPNLYIKYSKMFGVNKTVKEQVQITDSIVPPDKPQIESPPQEKPSYYISEDDMPF